MPTYFIDQIVNVGELNLQHGFSSMKFVPGSNDRDIIALKTIETNGATETFVLMFDVEGKELLKETSIGTQKFEGLEFTLF